MNTPKNPAQSEQNTTPNPQINFNHRLSETYGDENSRLSDTIGLMTERALGILKTLSWYFESGGNRSDDKTIIGAIDAAILEIEDIRATLIAFDEAHYSQV